MFSGAVQAGDPPPMPRVCLVEQVEREGRSHGGRNHRTSEHLADDGDGVGMDDNGQKNRGRQPWW